jgi:indoleacetamide hydrolase
MKTNINNTRRNFVLSGSGIGFFALAPNVLTACGGGGSDSKISKAQMLEMDAVEAAKLIQTRQVTAVAYTQTLLERSKQLSEYRAYITLNETDALASAAKIDLEISLGNSPGRLAGIPIAFKDIYSTKGLKTSYGTKLLKDFLPEEDSTAISLLKAEGAIILGKTNCQELSYGSNGYNSHYGQTLNPYDAKLISGGSSGGSAVAVASRGTPIGMGSDTAASIRNPAALCGLVGFRPSTGRYATKGVAPISNTLDTIGPLCRSVRDAALIDEILSKDSTYAATPEPKTIRLGVPRAYFYDGLDPVVQQAMDQYLAKLKTAGVTLVEKDISGLGPLTDENLLNILLYETYPDLSKFLLQEKTGTTIEQLSSAVGSDVKSFWDPLVLLNSPARPTETAYLASLAKRLEAISLVKAYFEDNKLDAWIVPAIVTTATKAEGADNQGADATISYNGQTTSLYVNDRNGNPPAFVGMPSLTLPITLSPVGLPIGIGLDALPGHDRKLLAIGSALESITTKIKAPAI